MESIPFYHAERLFTIFFVEDLAFVEVRAVLDVLLDEDVFDPGTGGPDRMYEVEVEDSSFKVWVNDFNVAIHKLGSYSETH
jgi:hypothetical protein